MAVFLFVTACRGPAHRARGPGSVGICPRGGVAAGRPCVAVGSRSPGERIMASSMNGAWHLHVERR